MQIKEREINGVFEIQLQPISDHRGLFMRTYDHKLLAKHGISEHWVQENHSLSLKKGTIRGLHVQLAPYSEAKLVRVVKGEIFDVFVDLRLNSPTFGKWGSIILSQANNKMIYIPRGFAHGYCSLADDSIVVYKVDNYFTPTFETGIMWNDPTINIDWPISQPILSEKDAKLPSFNEYVKNYKGIAV